MHDFRSDNVAGAAPEVITALATASTGQAAPYGNDALTARVTERLSAIFETQVAVFPVATGTAANALALSALAPPFGAIYCYEEAHITVDECGAPEFFTGGAKLVPLPGAHGKLTPDTVARAVARAGVGVVHKVQPSALSLTQATEAGTVYRPDEVEALVEVAHAGGMAVHMDGARFANAVARLGCAPAALTWKAGVDVLTLGGTKGGCLAAEAVVFFNPAMAEDFGYARKRGGHLVSKTRFLSAQLDAWLADELWLRLSGHANTMADRLAAGLGKLPGVVLEYPVEANELFVRLPESTIAALEAAGFGFYRWDDGLVRLVTAFDTPATSVDAFLKIASGT
ncbi:low specificity L-threonine aldolase [Azospirillum doebereinerae]|uniref:threonine aldolase family protein n=1 Tax=Azospirillum doebereinerae TaxID=92933 RepID=UPI001EE52ADD|nr:low specificity L-threonine aldolase [Azospirillum doebereinerae]MCG5240963.1 low specificity L-threonine aldolase [Azospirillum doebereinerae]